MKNYRRYGNSVPVAIKIACAMLASRTASCNKGAVRLKHNRRGEVYSLTPTKVSEHWKQQQAFSQLPNHRIRMISAISTLSQTSRPLAFCANFRYQHPSSRDLSAFLFVLAPRGGLLGLRSESSGLRKIITVDILLYPTSHEVSSWCWS